MTWAPGKRDKTWPGSRTFERRMPEPMLTTAVFATWRSIRIGQFSGSPMGVMPPYSMPLSSTALLGEERGLAHVERPLDHVVDVGPIGGQDHTSGDPLDPLPLSADDDTVGQGVHGQPEHHLRGGRVGHRGIDLDHADGVKEVGRLQRRPSPRGE